MKAVRVTAAAPLAAGLAALPLLVVAACGGSRLADPASRPSPGAASTTGAEPEPQPDREVQVEGLLGSIPRQVVEQTLNGRIQRFGRCFFARSEQLEVLGGRMTLAFRIGTDGTVRWVVPKASTVGDRTTERCVLDEAARTRFPPPSGGEAEASWSFEMAPDEHVRPPVSLHPSQFEALAVQHAAELRRRCGEGPFRVTVYLAPGGRLLAAGGAADDPERARALDCVVAQLQRWEGWPDPGSYVGKGSFQVP